MSLTETKVTRDNYTVSTILEAFDQKLLRDDHPQQRHAEQHSNEYRDGFIATVIKNEDFDSIKVCEQIIGGNPVLWLIDGLQRISEIRAYRNNAFKLGRTVNNSIIYYSVPKKNEEGVEIRDENGNPVYEKIEFDLKGKSYNDLPRVLKMQFDSCPIEVVKHLKCTTDDIAYHMRRYNHQTKMNGAQISLTYAPNWAGAIQDIANNNKFFLDCGNYTANDVKRGNIPRIVEESVMAIFHLDDWKKQTAGMGAFINDNCTRSEFEKLNEYLDRLYPICEGKYANIFNSKNTFLFVAAFHWFLKLDLPDERFGEFLDAFDTLYDKEINGVSFAMLEENRATKDRKLVTSKIELLARLMHGFFNKDFNEDFNTETDKETEDVNKSKNNEKHDSGTEQKDIEMISSLTGYSIDEISENINFYYQCLDDSLDRTVKMDAPLRDACNRIPLVSALIHGYAIDADVEDWIGWYGVNVTSFPVNIEDNYRNMVESLESFDVYKQKIA